MPYNTRIQVTLNAIGSTQTWGTFSSGQRNVTIWPHGVIGYSFTQYAATQTFWINVYSAILGVTYLISGVTAIASAASGVFKLSQGVQNAAGITQFDWGSVPSPTHATIQGTSTGAGLTGTVVITAALYSP